LLTTFLIQVMQSASSINPSMILNSKPQRSVQIQDGNGYASHQGHTAGGKPAVGFNELLTPAEQESKDGELTARMDLMEASLRESRQRVRMRDGGHSAPIVTVCSLCQQQREMLEKKMQKTVNENLQRKQQQMQALVHQQTAPDSAGQSSVGLDQSQRVGGGGSPTNRSQAGSATGSRSTRGGPETPANARKPLRSAASAATAARTKKRTFRSAREMEEQV
jgi:hypothetical protein